MAKASIKKILVIEESIEFKRVLSRFFLKKFPSAKIEEINLKQGCPDNTFPWHQFDLLLLNCNLGKYGNGLNWLKINKTNNDFPSTIFVSDEDDTKLVAQALRYGAHDYLIKTALSVSELNDVVDRAINKHANETSIKGYNKLLSHKLINRVELYKKLDDINHGTLLLISIDKFKDIHYQFGLIVTDALSTHLAKIIIQCSAVIKTGTVDIIRINDDIIAVLILGARDQFYKKFVQHLFHHISTTHFEYEEQKIHYKISIGITHFEENSSGAHDNIARADAAMRLAMNESKNSFTVFGEKKTNEKSFDIKAINKIKELIKKDRLQPFFQPIVYISTSNKPFNIQMYQVRTKLNDVDGKMLKYKDFAMILEQTKMVKKFDYCVIKKMIQALHQIQSENQVEIGFLISLEKDTLGDEKIIKWIKQLSNFFGTSNLTSSIVFEIPSEYVMIHQKNIFNIMLKLRDAYGIAFSLTHVCSVSILEQCMSNISFEFVKIPMYETVGDINKPSNVDELKLITQYSKNQGAMVISDKIDDAHHLASAIECGTDFVSGYLIHAPQHNIPLEYEVML